MSTVEEFRVAANVARAAADGDSNDTEIEALQAALELAEELLLRRPVEPVGYNVCPNNPDAVHGPVSAHVDPDAPRGYLAIICDACGTTTSVLAPESGDIEWN